MQHTEPRNAAKIPPIAVAPVHPFMRCACGSTLTSGQQLCDQCSRRKAFTNLGDNCVNETAGT